MPDRSAFTYTFHNIARVPEAKKIDAVLDPRGQQRHARLPRHAAPRGRSCLAGWLGGLDPIPYFNPLLQMASGGLSDIFWQLRLRNAGLSPLRCALQQIAADAAAGRLDVKPTRISRFEEIREAHRVMEANEAVRRTA